MTPHDRTLLEQMDVGLKAFRSGTLDFRILLDRLEACVENMSDAEAAWKDAFRSEWGILEDIYAFAVAENMKTLPENDMPMVDAALGALRQMVVEKLRN
jgi:hypothetical protein